MLKFYLFVLRLVVIVNFIVKFNVLIFRVFTIAIKMFKSIFCLFCVVIIMVILAIFNS